MTMSLDQIIAKKWFQEDLASLAVPDEAQALLGAGWTGVWSGEEERWLRWARLPVREVGGDAYAPAWASDLYAHLLTDEPRTATEGDLALLQALGSRLAAGLEPAAIEAAHRLGGPEAVVGLVRGLP